MSINEIKYIDVYLYQTIILYSQYARRIINNNNFEIFFQ